MRNKELFGIKKTDYKYDTNTMILTFKDTESLKKLIAFIEEKD